MSRNGADVMILKKLLMGIKMTKDYIIETTCPKCEGHGDDARDFFQAPELRPPCPSCTEGKVKMNVIMRKECDFFILGRHCKNGFMHPHWKQGDICPQCKGTGYIERYMTVQEAEEIKHDIVALIEDDYEMKINGWTIDRLEVVE